MAIAPPIPMKISSAAAKKILKEREKRGGSGGGSFNPMRTGGALSVTPEDGSVALIVRPGPRRVVLAVLVLVELRFEVRDVEANLDGLVGAAADRHRHFRLARLLVPDLEDERPRRNAVESEGPVGPGHGREVRIDDHHEADHLWVDIAIDAHETRCIELLILRRAALVEPEVEAVPAGNGKDVVVDRVRVGEVHRAVDAQRDDPGREFLLLASHLAPRRRR